MTKHVDPKSFPPELASIRKHMVRVRPDRLAVAQSEECVIYGRFSTRNQRYASILRQRDVCVAYAGFKNFKLREEYLFADEGCTGDSLDGRKALERVRQLVRSRAIKRILIYSWCRWSRRPGDAMTLFDECLCHGVEMHVCSGSITGNINTFQALFLSVFAMEEREKTLSQTNYAAFAAAAAGKNMGSFAYGLRRGKKVGDIELDPTVLPNGQTKIDIVKEIFHLSVKKKMHPTHVAYSLNERGIPSPKNKRWKKSTVLAILRNVKYVGWMTHGVTKTHRTMGKSAKKRTAGELAKLEKSFNEQIACVDIDTFLEANALLDAMIPDDDAMPADAPRGERVSAGKVLLPDAYHCVCGARIRLNGTVRKSPTRRFNCAAAFDHGPSVCDRKVSVSSVYVEREVLREIRDNVISVEAVELFNGTYLVKARTERDAMIAEHQRITHEIAEKDRWLRNSYMESLKEGLSDARTAQVRADLEAEIEELGGKRAELTIPEEIHEVPTVEVDKIRKAINSLIRRQPFKELKGSDLDLVNSLRRLIGKVVIDRPDGGNGYTLRIEASLENLASNREMPSDGESRKPSQTIPSETFFRTCPAPGSYPVPTPEMLEYVDESLKRNAFGSTDEDWAVIEPLCEHWNCDRKRYILDAALYYLRFGCFGLKSLPAPFDGGYVIQYRVKEMVETGCWTSALEAMERIQSPTVKGLEALRRAARCKLLAPAP